jgi:hypothetical protein
MLTRYFTHWERPGSFQQNLKTVRSTRIEAYSLLLGFERGYDVKKTAKYGDANSAGTAFCEFSWRFIAICDCAVL